MSITLDKGTAKNRAQLARKRRAAMLVLAVEILTAALWRIGAWLCLFGGLWLLQIPSMFGAWGPGAALAAFLLGIVWFARSDLKILHWPRRDEIDRRLESAAALAHRPLEIIDDALVNDNAAHARRLWQRQKHAAFELIAALRLPIPRAIIARRDPFGLRIAAVLLLVVGLVVAGPQSADRLQHGLMPYPIKMPGQGVPYLTLWITPPEYTGQPRLTLQGSGLRGEKIKIPAGSIVKVRINGRVGQPVLKMADKSFPMERLDKKSWGVEIPIEPGDALRVTQLYVPRATVPYELLPDAPPVITVEGEPAVMERGELQFTVKLRDDYGVADMGMTVDLDPLVEDRPMGAPFTETRAVMSGPNADMELKPLYDLGWHPWAGLPVVVTFTAKDQLGQTTTATPLKITLPERTFRHPVAAALVAERKKLIWAPGDAATMTGVAQAIEKLMARPDAFAQDMTVFLSLRVMSSRLIYTPTAQSSAEVIAQLWDTAIRIEDGNLPLASRELRAARADLEKLLNDPNATPEQIAKAMEDLRQAMAEYFRELAREMQKRFAQGENVGLPPELFESLMNPEDLANFLDQLQSQALTGDKDAAKEMLSQLQQLMDNLDPSTGMQMPPEMEFMQEGINELQQLIEKQQALHDKTESYVLPEETVRRPLPESMPEFTPLDPKLSREWGEDGTLPPPPAAREPMEQPAQRSVDTQGHVPEQESLRYILGRLMLQADEQTGEIPESMGLAEQEMRLSAEQLRKNDPGQSAPHQQKAIEHLQESMQQMNQQMAQMMKQMMMLSMGPGKMDPLGRPMEEGRGPSWLPGSQVKIPDEAERKRVQEIQKLLRDRSGELERPDYELDYFRRLLKQF
jgi:uncharacterized protein (TIGR02302 family)